MTADTASYLPAGLPQPAANVDGLEAPYWQATRRHELVVQRCNDCETYQWGPEWICHHCRSFDIGWTDVPPRGHIYSWERVWYPVHPALQAKLPYLVVLVELPDAGNIRMVGNLLGDPEAEVTIGAEVEAVFEDHGGDSNDDDDDEGYTLVQWRVVEHS
ncbi:MAG: OB-fold domain-containing protein [Dehalococcoidia bacterium]